MRTVTATLVAAVLATALVIAQSPAPAPAAPLYAAIYKTGPKWDAAKPPNEQAFFREHSANLAKLRAAGTIVMGARYADIGLVVVTAANVDDARAAQDIFARQVVTSIVFDVELMAVADTLPSAPLAPGQRPPAAPACPTWEIVKP